MHEFEPITLHAEIVNAETDERRITVETWPRYTMFDSELLKTARDDVFTVDDDQVTLTVANGRAVYQLDRDAYDILNLAIPAYLIQSRLSER